MLRRPSARRKSAHKGEIELNLVPMLDALVTLIAFLLFTMSFLAIVSVDSPLPYSTPELTKELMKKRPLQLTLDISPDHVEVSSPFNLIPKKLITNNPDGKPDLYTLHTFLVEVKLKFPHESAAVFHPHTGTTYDVLIALMDTVRLLDKTDPAVIVPNPKTGVNEIQKMLFNDIVFTGVGE